MIDRTPRRQIVGQQFLCAAAANRVTNPSHDLTPRVLGRPPAGFGCGHERFQAIPFRISDIRIVGSTVFHVDRLRDYLFKRALRLSLVFSEYGVEVKGTRVRLNWRLARPRV
jgi:hypothetical protein